MTCRSCDEFGLMIMKRMADNTRFVFKCSCGKSSLNYPFWSHTFSGFKPWMTSNDLGCSLQDFKKNNLRLVNNSDYVLKEMDVSLEVEALKKEQPLMRPVDLPEFEIVPF